MIGAWFLLLIIAFSAFCLACKEQDDRRWEEKTLAEQERMDGADDAVDN